MKDTEGPNIGKTKKKRNDGTVKVQPLEGEIQDAQPSSRFNAVIEKIERLYMGKQSSDEEELDDIPDDDQYDTEDSFIDDAELDEYFQVDKLSTKHNGYFVNRGKLERVEPSSSPNLAPKNRKRKDSIKVNAETCREHVTSDAMVKGNVRMKAAARSAPLMEKKLASPDEMQTAYEEYYQERKVLKNKSNSFTGSYKRRSADSMTNLKNTSPVRISKDVSSLSSEWKDLDKHKAGVLLSRDLSHKSRLINESVESAYHSSRDRAVSSQAESQSRKSINCENEAEVSTKIRRKERYRTDVFPITDSAVGAYPMQAALPSSRRVKDGSALRPKGTTLERAIRDLEKIVALYRPPKLDIQEADNSSQLVKRRLPQEVKQKLAKVARLSASQNKISEDVLIDRLMGIVGHIVQRTTLKRKLRALVESGQSAKQEKVDRFRQIKQDVNEMIKTRLSYLKSMIPERHDGSADDFQEVNGGDEKKALRKHGMDFALEDKICELYELYVEGMDDDKHPQSRKKLYQELAELWPNGYMDSNGIKDAIFRSKERRRQRIYRDKAREEERIKRKKLAAASRAEGTSLGAQARPATESTAVVLGPQEKNTADQPVSSSVRTLEPSSVSSDAVHHHISKHHDKARLSSSTTNMILGDGSKIIVADAKKKMKRKPELDLGEIHAHPTKLPSQLGKEKPSSHKQTEDLNAVDKLKPNLNLPAAPVSSDQQS
ncbi:ubinuclein-1-like [Asparagus officinalis]|uniref:ubinuclein-1-like n=1 Tax=Asparagus officinalis TaxID=4686 RepID=UPI00098E12AC|nr:ubinuclein-1-like [Asparagus officinalis]